MKLYFKWENCGDWNEMFNDGRRRSCVKTRTTTGDTLSSYEGEKIKHDIEMFRIYLQKIQKQMGLVAYNVNL